MLAALHQLILDSEIRHEVGGNPKLASRCHWKVLDFVEHISKCQSIADIDAVCQSMRKHYGFDFYALFVRVPKVDGPAISFFLREYEDAWTQHYDKQKFMLRDPTIRQALVTTSAYVWSSTMYHQVEQSLHPDEYVISQDALDFGLRDIFNAPFRGACGDVGLIRFIHRAQGQSSLRERLRLSEKVPELYLLSSQLFERIVNILREGSCPLSLSSRECDVLRWTALGVSPVVVGDRLHISENTVNKHLANVRRKLGVRSTTHAVAKAISMRAIVI